MLKHPNTTAFSTAMAHRPWAGYLHATLGFFTMFLNQFYNCQFLSFWGILPDLPNLSTLTEFPGKFKFLISIPPSLSIPFKSHLKLGRRQDTLWTGHSSIPGHI